MVVIDEINKEITPMHKCVRGIVYKSKEYVEFGYFVSNEDMPFTFYQDSFYYDISNMNAETEIIFSLINGCNRKFLKNDPKIKEHLNVFGNGNFPYSIEREYEARHYIKDFEDTVKVSDSSSEQYAFSKDLKYSFGIEFETAAGYLPENTCFELGLIPLRDGSISGIEYSTIPMKGNEGINLLKRQMEALKKYTYTNKECSIHIHFGGYPIDAKALYILHSLWYFTQFRLREHIPSWSYNTNYFKKNEKNYCGEVSWFEDFKSMYRHYVGENYLGDLYQPHPCDINKQAKWNVKTRYYNCNFINALCYNGAKTIEFRFLTPTYSFEKLTTYLLILNAILTYAETLYEKLKNKTYKEIREFIVAADNNCYTVIKNIIKTVYDTANAETILNNLTKINWMLRTQTNVGDHHGGRLDIENRYFPDGKQEN